MLSSDDSGSALPLPSVLPSTSNFRPTPAPAAPGSHAPNLTIPQKAISARGNAAPNRSAKKRRMLLTESQEAQSASPEEEEEMAVSNFHPASAGIMDDDETQDEETQYD